MRKVLVASTALFLAAVIVPSAWSDTFFTGRIDTNGSAAGGNDFTDVKEITGAGGGFGHNNVYATGAGGMAATGDKITSMGIVVLAGAQFGALSDSFDTGNDLVMVYALQGTVTVDAMGNLRSNFDPGDSASHFGAAGFYDRSALGALGPNPSTWVNDVMNATDGLLALVQLSPRPDAVLQGLPGGNVTAAPLVPLPEEINTQMIEVQAAVNTRGQYKADTVDLGTFLENPNTILPPGWTSTTDLGSFFADLIQDLDAGTNNTDGLVLSDLNDLYDDLLDQIGQVGGGFATALDAPGSGYDPANFLSGNGDVLLLNNQFILNPGDQAIQEFNGQTPEPASLILWSLALVGSAGYGLRRRMKAAA